MRGKLQNVGPILLACLVLLLVLAYNALLPSLDQPADSDRYLVLDSGAYTKEPLDESSWQSTAFPIHWRHTFQSTTEVWYRFDLSPEQLIALSGGEQLLGVYLWRLNQTADVYFNDVLIGTGGEESVRYWNSPLYFTIPMSLVQDSHNELVIHHLANHGWGSMQNIIIAADSLLRPQFKTRYFIQHDLSIALFALVILGGVFCLAVWFYGRREASYLWYAIASVGSAIYCANQFVNHLWFDPNVWRWITNVGTDLWACAIVLVILRSLQIERPSVQLVCLGYFLFGIPYYLYASFFQAYDLNIYGHVLAVCLVVYVAFEAVRHYFKTHDSLALFYAAILFIGAIAGIHDTVMQAVVNVGWSGSGFRYRFNVLQFIAPIGFLFLGVNLVRQFINSLNQADHLNAELEDRVAEAREELQENYQLMQDVLVAQSATEERERIYRDLHDDVGSKLLSLYYRLEDETNSTLAKSALEDLRDIVSRNSMANCSLSKLVPQWQAEAFGRTQDAKLDLNWSFDHGADDPILDQSQQAQLQRMLREVFSNAILHNPNATQIDTLIKVADGQLMFSLKNNGTSRPTTEWYPGRGISNLQLRARELGGSLSIVDSADGWAEVKWSIPITNMEANHA